MTNNTHLEENNSHTVLLGRILSTLSAHKFLVIFLFLGVFGGAYAALQMMTEQYETTAAVLVKLGRENMETPATVNQGGIFATGVRPEDINSEIQLMSSPALIEATVDAMGPSAFKREEQKPVGFLKLAKYHIKQAVRWVKGEYENLLIVLNLKKDLQERQKIIDDIGSRLVVERLKESDVISVSVKMPDPELAARLLDTLLKLYLDKHVDIHRSPDIREFFDTQATAHLERLSALDKQRDEIRKHWNVIDVAEQKELLLKRANELYVQMDGLRTEQHLLGDIHRPGGTECSPEQRDEDLISDERALSVLREKIASLKSEKIRLLELYEKNSLSIANLDRDLHCLLSVVGRSVSGRLRLLEEQAAGVERELRGLNEGEAKLEVIERERLFSKENYLSYLKRREEARVSEEMDIRRVSNVSVLNRPSSSLQPVYPKKMLIMGLSIPLGLVLGLGIALLMDYLGGIIRSPYDLQDIEGMDFIGEFKYKPGKRR